ncbi:MAG: aminotransferase class I/II-fold pyridoxal phosphate-dependent enzyme [Bacteroidota bacterium]
MINLLADHLENSTTGKTQHSQKWASPNERLEFWQKEWEKEGFDLAVFTEQILEQSLHLHHPKCIGHQVGVSAPITVLMSLVSSLLNNGMAIYEVGQAATVIEQLVIQKIVSRFGFGENTGGVLTSGGTLGNLTALITARNVKAKGEVWRNGQQQQFGVMVSEEAHYCVDRAVKTMGWGEQGAIKVPVNQQFKMEIELLPDLLTKAKAQNIQVVAVVGSACSTSTGSFDDLTAIADFCEENDLWFHVDGAHGGAAIFSDKYRHLLKGIDRADSVIMDFHKMLLTPALTTGLFYKNAQHSYQTFAQKAHYLWSNSESEEWYNLGKRTYECTKLMMSLKLYALLKTHGFELWEKYTERAFDLGQQFAELIKNTPDFELAIQPNCNIVCFRYLGGDDLNRLNEKIRYQLLEEGEFYIVKTQLQNKTYLRTTLMSPFTTIEHLRLLLERIVAIANKI